MGAFLLLKKASVHTAKEHQNSKKRVKCSENDDGKSRV